MEIARPKIAFLPKKGSLNFIAKNPLRILQIDTNLSSKKNYSFNQFTKVVVDGIEYSSFPLDGRPTICPVCAGPLVTESNPTTKRSIRISFTNTQYEWIKQRAAKKNYNPQEYILNLIHHASHVMPPVWRISNIDFTYRYNLNQKEPLANYGESVSEMFTPDTGLPSTNGEKRKKSVTINFDEAQFSWLKAAAENKNRYKPTIAASYMRWLIRIVTSLTKYRYG